MAVHAINNLIVFLFMLDVSRDAPAESAEPAGSLVLLGVVLAIAFFWVALTLYLDRPKRWALDSPSPENLTE